ncbi:MAG: hypothetical protein BAJALOKI2v1_750018 [Promethearchaeota archaeon]|jgi:hypothetical protein|nr:MAG: hypothetical protein BAJALOKI2v1_750018 [Candidatus Lokiarchaeota archaeon]
MSEKKENVVDKLNNALLDFVGQTFGDSGRDFIEDTQDKVKELSSTSVKRFMDFSDSVIENLNLKDNDQVIKARDTVEDLLKQAGLLEEEFEEEEF